MPTKETKDILSQVRTFLVNRSKEVSSFEVGEKRGAALQQEQAYAKGYVTSLQDVDKIIKKLLVNE